MRNREFVSFVVLARQVGDSDLKEILTRLNEIGQQVSKYHEIIALRSPRRSKSAEDQSDLSATVSNTTFVETSGAMTTASLAVTGLERSLGDFIVVLGPTLDEANFSKELVQRVDENTPVHFGIPAAGSKRQGTFGYRIGKLALLALLRIFGGKRAVTDSPLFRVMTREVVIHILNSSEPAHTFRSLGSRARFASKFVEFKISSSSAAPKFWESYGSAMQILFGGSKVPLRLASLIAILGAGLNVLYGLYVLGVSLVDPGIERGWASLSLQSSGMFFLICVVLFIMTEYLLRLIDDSSSLAVTTSTNFDGDLGSGATHRNVDFFSENEDEE